MSAVLRRPADVAHLRSQLRSFYATSEAKELWEITAERSDSYYGIPTTRADGPDLLAAEKERVEAAELFYVGEDMTMLCLQAAPTLPVFELAEHDVPAPAGLMLFATPIGWLSHPDDSYRVPIQLFSWDIFTLRRNGARFLALHSYSLRDGAEPGFPHPLPAPWPIAMYDAETVWPLGKRDDLDAWTDTARKSWPASLLAAFRLIQQPLASEASEALPRADRRRLARAGSPDEGAIRVLTLRRTHGEGGAPGTREWLHRWVVGGHWRNQWYPSIKAHRPVWIAPYLKGPVDAPLLGGDKVYALVR